MNSLQSLDLYSDKLQSVSPCYLCGGSESLGATNRGQEPKCAHDELFLILFLKISRLFMPMHVCEPRPHTRARGVQGREADAARAAGGEDAATAGEGGSPARPARRRRASLSRFLPPPSPFLPLLLPPPPFAPSP
jgi:hypothetical protein